MNLDALGGSAGGAPPMTQTDVSAADEPTAAGGRPRVGRMLLVTVGWGACFVAIRLGLNDAPVLWFAALRAVLAGGALLAVGCVLHRAAPPRPTWPAIALLGLVNVTVGFSAMFAGTVGLTSGVAAVLANAQPLLIVLPAWAMYRGQPRPRAAAEGPPSVSWTTQFVLGLLFLGLVGSAATYLIWFIELQCASLLTLSAWTMLTPIFGVAIGWLLLGDRLSPQQTLGTARVITALPIILLPDRRR